ncbi:MAG: YceI family protein, partial [Bacteroidia bacterium]
MKRLTNFVITRTGLICLIGLGGLLFAVAFATSGHDLTYKSVESKVSLSSINMSNEAKLEAANFACETSVVLDGDQVSDISGFSFNIPITQFKHADPLIEDAIRQLLASGGAKYISFKQHHVMVLPTMKMIHLIGELNIAKVSRPVAFQLEFDFNKNKELVLKGKQAIQLSDFGIVIPEDLQVHFKDDFNIDLSAVMTEKMDRSL